MGGSSAWSYLTDYLPCDLGSSVGESHMMAATEARGMWQRTAAKCHLVKEDATRSSKIAECPLPHIISRSQTDTCHPPGYSYFWSNSWGSVDPRFSPESKRDLQWQFSPTTRRDYQSELSGLDESLSARFSKPTGLQSLAAETNSSLKSVPGFMGDGSDYTSAELEFEWQLIVDPHPKSVFESPVYDTEICKDCGELTFKETVRESKHEWPERTQQVNNCEVGTSEIMKRSNKVGLYGSHSGTALQKERPSAPELRADSEHQDMSSRSAFKRSLFWQEADKKPLGVAQQAEEHLENCDLRCPRSSLIQKAALTNFAINPLIEKQRDSSRSFDQNVLPSLQHGNEPTALENSDHASHSLVLGNLDSTPWRAGPAHFQRVTEPLNIPAIETPPIGCESHSFSIDSTNSSWLGGITMDRGLLGEALCRSQTRAREAEKKAYEAYEERERLMHMFFKEASLAFTYRQWVNSLQTENMWLRMSSRHEPVAWLQRSIFNPFSSKRWQRVGQNCHTKCHMDQTVTSMWHEKHLVYVGNPDDILMGYTLAFAVGLSFAGAGLMLGWSMGWILLT